MAHRRRLGHRPGRRRRSPSCAGDGVDWLVNARPAAARLGPRSSRPRCCSSTTPSTTACSAPLGVAAGRRARQVDPVHARVQPRPGPRPAAGLPVLRPAALRPQRRPAAIIIHFFGGIHEIYFPYVLMKPRLILAMIAGGAAGIAIVHGHRRRPVATPSPGSIFAYMAVTPRGGYFGVLARHRSSPPPSRSPSPRCLLGFGRAATTTRTARAEVGTDQGRQRRGWTAAEPRRQHRTVPAARASVQDGR